MKKCFACLALSWIVAVGAPLVAYNHSTHQELTDLAWEVMLVVEGGGTVGGRSITDTPPEGVGAAEWQSFLGELSAAMAPLRGLPSGLPEPKSNDCVLEGVGNVLADDWAATSMGSLAHVPRTDYISGPEGIDCGVSTSWAPGGIFNATNPQGDRDRTGMVLGFWGALVDDEFDDTHLWFRPSSSVGFGPMKDFINDGVSLGLGVIFAPLACLADCIFDDCDCGSPDDIGNDLNFGDDLEGLLPGFGDVSGPDFVGFWHHINMGDWASNDFDDRQGLFLEEAGWEGMPDPVDLLMWVGMDLSGMSIDYGDSLGPKRYTVANSADAHEATEERNEGEWQFNSIVHTPMEPLDNLGVFGWRRFLAAAGNDWELPVPIQEEGHPVRFIGWPLHALGDAIAPHHLIGTAAWGHREFEDTYERLWTGIRFLSAAGADATGDEIRHQREQARRILDRAFDWWRFLRAWHTLHPELDDELPVRALVTELASQSFDYASSKMDTDDWPYDPLASTMTLQQFGDAGIDRYEGRDDAIPLAQPLFENSAGAQIAFLVAVGERLP